MARCVPEFFRLHAARATAPNMPPHANTFARPEARAFVSDLFARWSRKGIALAFLLVHDGRPVACRLAFRMRDTLYFYYSGFDPSYAQYSVMTRAMVEGLQWAAERGTRAVNLSTGTDVAKTRWRPACLEFETFWQWNRSPRGRAARWLHRLLRHDWRS